MSRGVKVCIFCTQYSHLVPRKGLLFLWGYQWRLCHFAVGLWLWYTWHGYVHINTHSFKTSLSLSLWTSSAPYTWQWLSAFIRVTWEVPVDSIISVCISDEWVCCLWFCTPLECLNVLFENYLLSVESHNTRMTTNRISYHQDTNLALNCDFHIKRDQNKYIVYQVVDIIKYYSQLCF